MRKTLDTAGPTVAVGARTLLVTSLAANLGSSAVELVPGSGELLKGVFAEASKDLLDACLKARCGDFKHPAGSNTSSLATIIFHKDKRLCKAAYMMH